MREELGVVPDSTIYNCMINVHAQSGDVIGAELLQREMKEELNLSPDVFASNSMIDAHLRRGNLASVHRILRALPAAIDLEQNMALSTSLLNGEAGDLLDADAMLREMLEDIKMEDDFLTLSAGASRNDILLENPASTSVKCASDVSPLIADDNIDKVTLIHDAFINIEPPAKFAIELEQNKRVATMDENSPIGDDNSGKDACEINNAPIIDKKSESNSDIHAFVHKGDTASANKILRLMRSKFMEPDAKTMNSVTTLLRWIAA